MTGKPPGRVFRFGVFEADEAAGELRKQGLLIKLHSQPFQVLIMLLERPATLVTRDEIKQRLWGGETNVDFDHGMNTAINKIRQALRDSAAEPRYIETVSGKGYRFIVPVLTGEPAPQAPPNDLPVAPRRLVAGLLIASQAMYLAFYLGALANLPEIHDIFEESRIPLPDVVFGALVITAAALIPVRLFLAAAVALDYRQLPSKFHRLFPAILVLDLLWALSPFLLIHHINTGLALGLSAPLVYMPFAQRSLILMYHPMWSSSRARRIPIA